MKVTWEIELDDGAHGEETLIVRVEDGEGCIPRKLPRRCCHNCGEENCVPTFKAGSCEGETTVQTSISRSQYNAAIQALETLTLFQACNGCDIGCEPNIAALNETLRMLYEKHKE